MPTKQHTTNALVTLPPQAFGGQDNPNFNTSQKTFQTAYTIPVTNFKPGKSYLIIASWVIGPDSTGSSRLTHDGSIINGSEFETFANYPNGGSNCMCMFRITQPSIVKTVNLEVKNWQYSPPTANFNVNYVRWFVIDESTIPTSDYVFAETTTPLDLTNSYQSVLETTINTNHDDWVVFYNNKLQASPTPSYDPLQVNVTTRFNFNDVASFESNVQGFNTIGVNRVTPYMQFVRSDISGSGTKTLKLETKKNQFPIFTGFVYSTGQILAIKLSLLMGTMQDTNTPPITKSVPVGTWTVLNAGWNAAVLTPATTDGISIPDGSENGVSGASGGSITVVKSDPMQFDWRTDELIYGSHIFSYPDTTLNSNVRTRQGVFIFSIPNFAILKSHFTSFDTVGSYAKHFTSIATWKTIKPEHLTSVAIAVVKDVQHTTSFAVNIVKILGHVTGSLILLESSVQHTTSCFLEDRTVLGGGSILIGINVLGGGVVDSTPIAFNQGCSNYNTLRKYNWEQSNQTIRKCR